MVWIVRCIAVCLMRFTGRTGERWVSRSVEAKVLLVFIACCQFLFLLEGCDCGFLGPKAYLARYTLEAFVSMKKMPTRVCSLKHTRED